MTDDRVGTVGAFNFHFLGSASERKAVEAEDGDAALNLYFDGDEGMTVVGPWEDVIDVINSLAARAVVERDNAIRKRMTDVIALSGIVDENTAHRIAVELFKAGGTI